MRTGLLWKVNSKEDREGRAPGPRNFTQVARPRAHLCRRCESGESHVGRVRCQGGSLRTCRDPSAGCVGRIRKAGAGMAGSQPDWGEGASRAFEGTQLRSADPAGGEAAQGCPT